MIKLRKFFSRSVVMIGGLVGIVFPICFSSAQNYGPIENVLLNRTFTFIMPSSPIYLYTIIEPNTYTIYFDGNGNTSGDMTGMNMIYDRNENLLANKFIKKGFIFEGRSRTKTGAVEYLDESEVKNLTTEDLGSVTLYAQRSRGTGDIDVSYTANYYLENIAGTGYDLVETGIINCTGEHQIILTGNIYTGFTLQTGAEIEIELDGSTVVPYYYHRNKYNLIVKDRNNIIIDTGIKFEVDITPLLPESLTGWTGNTFSGWQGVPGSGLMPADDVEITSEWIYGVHSITFDTDGGSEVITITGNYGDPVIVPANPTKEGYEFVRWEPAIPSTIKEDDITVTAIWKKIDRGGRSGRGGTSNKSENQHGAAIDEKVHGSGNSVKKDKLEVLRAYMWAYDNGIIDSTRKTSDIDGYIPRGDMAEMIVKFTENVLGREIPEVPPHCRRGDAKRDWKSAELKEYAEKACALGVMGIRVKKFMPNKLVDRAEFGTILSRILRGDTYDVVDATDTKPYYTRHLEALNREGIMKQIENPESRNELRKWAWLMLMRVNYKN